MGRRGPQKTPTGILEKRNSQLLRLRIGEIKPLGEMEKPSWVKGRATHIWNIIVEELRKAGVGAKIDSGALGRYCIYLKMYVDTVAAVNKQKTLIFEYATSSGAMCMQVRPEVTVLKNLEAMLRSLESAFGITPAARAGLVAEKTPGQKDDKKTAWLTRQKQTA
jgi:P27 family predicted phage terminase small subunit